MQCLFERLKLFPISQNLYGTGESLKITINVHIEIGGLDGMKKIEIKELNGMKKQGNGRAGQAYHTRGNKGRKRKRHRSIMKRKMTEREQTFIITNLLILVQK